MAGNTHLPALLYCCINLFVQHSQCHLPPLRPLCGEAPGRDLNLGRADLVEGTLLVSPPQPQNQLKNFLTFYMPALVFLLNPQNTWLKYDLISLSVSK